MDIAGMLHPPGWTIVQTVGTGVVLCIGWAIGRFLMDLVSGAVSRARK